MCVERTYLDVGVGVADGASVVGTDEGNSTRSNLSALDLAKLVSSFLGLDAVKGEAALDVVKQAELLVRAVDGDNIHETSGEGLVRADLSIHRHEALHEDLGYLATGQGILEAVTEEDHKRDALTEFVRTGRRAGSKNTCA